MRPHSQRARQGAPCRSELRLAGHCRVKGDRSLFWVVLRLAWKLSRRRWERQSPLLGGIAVLVTVIGVGSAVTALFMAYLLGVSLLPGLEPFTVLLVWDAVIVAFLVLWLAGLLVQLQLGGESLALEKLRHMPVSPMGAFLMNFASAQMRVSLVISLAVMLGLAGASAMVLGAGHLILLPLVMATVVLVAAVTHQFQSWLGRIVTNKRRRGTVVAVAVVVFVLLMNLPGLITNRFMRDADVDAWDSARVEQWTLVANAALPPGWMALGAWGAGRGQIWPGTLATFGMFGIAALSLRRSYRKTLGAMALDGLDGKLVPQRDPGSVTPPEKPPASAPQPARPSHADLAWNNRLRSPALVRARRFLRRLFHARTARGSFALRVPPGLGSLVERFSRRIPEHSRAVAGVAMRLWIRAPQGKIVLLSPLLLIMLYLIMFREIGSGDWAAHFAVLAMLALTIVMGFNLFANVFGQDGSGFRSVVMAGVQSKDLLLGKNLALAPYAFGIGLLAIVILQWMSPLRLTDVFANVAQLVILYLVGCMLGNSFSIRTPWAMSTTSMGMRNASAAMFLASFLIILMLALLVLPLALPMWIDRLLAAKGVLVPVYLVFSIIELVVVIAIYRRVLRSQAELLTERFESVLERVTEPVD